MAILNYVIGSLLMHHGRHIFHVQDWADGPHDSEPIKTADPVGMVLIITIMIIYLILSDLVSIPAWTSLSFLC